MATRSTSNDGTDTSGQEAAVTVAGSDVTVAPSTSDDFKATTLYHRDGRTREVDTLEAFYAAKYDGFVTDKPKKR